MYKKRIEFFRAFLRLATSTPKVDTVVYAQILILLRHKNNWGKSPGGRHGDPMDLVDLMDKVDGATVFCVHAVHCVHQDHQVHRVPMTAARTFAPFTAASMTFPREGRSRLISREELYREAIARDIHRARRFNAGR